MCKYYTICSENGVMVASSYEKVQSCINVYFHGRRWSKRFHCFAAAQEYALKHLCMIAPDRECPTWLVLDLIVVVGKLPFKAASDSTTSLIEPIIWFDP